MNDWNLTAVIEDNENIGTETSRFVCMRQELTQKDTVYLSVSYSNKYLNFNDALIIPESFHVVDFGSTDFTSLYSALQEFSPLRQRWKRIYRKEYVRGPECVQRNSKYVHIILVLHIIPSVTFSEIWVPIIRLILIFCVMFREHFTGP